MSTSFVISEFDPETETSVPVYIFRDRPIANIAADILEEHNPDFYYEVSWVEIDQPDLTALATERLITDYDEWSDTV